MNTSVNPTITSVSTTRYAIFPLRRLSCTWEISVRVVVVWPRRDARAVPLAVIRLVMRSQNPLAALTGDPQEPAGEHGEDQHEDHAEGRGAVVVARAAHRERVLIDEHHHGLRVVAHAAAAVGQHEGLDEHLHGGD